MHGTETSRFRTARMHIGKRQQALLPGQVRRGIAVVAQHAEDGRPGTFTHHQHGQRFALVFLPGGITLGIFAIGLERREQYRPAR